MNKKKDTNLANSIKKRGRPKKEVHKETPRKQIIKSEKSIKHVEQKLDVALVTKKPFMTKEESNRDQWIMLLEEYEVDENKIKKWYKVKSVFDINIYNQFCSLKSQFNFISLLQESMKEKNQEFNEIRKIIFKLFYETTY